MEAEKIGPYEIIRIISHHRSATIYHAHDPKNDRDVAIKVIPFGEIKDPSLYARFERELQLISSLEYQGIVPVFETSINGDCLYIVMPFMSGGSLADRLEDGPLSIEEASRIIQKLAPTLDAIHKTGITHRNLKPGNILFDDNNEPHLSDFASIKLAGADSHKDAIIGPPAYLSPEQAHFEEDVDGRSDIYSLGILLYEMLTGRLPFRSKTPLGFVLQHLTSPAPNIRDIDITLPESINRVIHRAISKNREERYPTVTNLAEALVSSYAYHESQDQQWADRINTPLPGIEKEIQVAKQEEIIQQNDHTPPSKRLSIGWIMISVFAILLGVGTFWFWMAGREAISPLVIAEPTRFTPSQTYSLVTSEGLKPFAPNTFTLTIFPAAKLPSVTEDQRVEQSHPIEIPPSPTPQPSASTFLPSKTPPYITMTPSLTQAATQIPVGPSSYTVQYNDTLFTIAGQLDLDLSYLMGMNGLFCDSSLLPGRELVIPPPGIGIVPSPASSIGAFNADQLRLLHTLNCVQNVEDLTFSPDGQILAIASEEAIFLWSVGDWKPLRRLKGHQTQVTAIAFSPDGQLIASGSTDRTIRIWSTTDGTQVQILRNHISEVTDLVFSPDGESMISTSLDQTVKIWDVSNWEIRDEKRGYAAHSAAFSLDGQLLAVGFNDFIRLYNTDSYSELGTMNSSKIVSHLTFSSNGLLLASSSDVWQVPNGLYIYHFESSFHKVLFTPDESALISGPQIWRLSNGERITYLQEPEKNSPRAVYAQDSIALSPDGRLFALGTQDGLYIWGVTEPIQYTPSDSTYILRNGDNFYNTAEKFNVSLEELFTLNKLSCDHVPFISQSLLIPPTINSSPLSAIHITADNISQITPIKTMDLQCSDFPGEILFSPDNASIISGNTLWRIPRESILIQGSSDASIEPFDDFPVLTISPDGHVAATYSGSEIQLWQVNDGRKVSTLQADNGKVITTAFSPDGKILAVGYDDKVIRLWDIEQAIDPILIEGYLAQKLIFTPDGEQLISISGDTARFWNWRVTALIANLQGIIGNVSLSPQGDLMAYIACEHRIGVHCSKHVTNLYRLTERRIGFTFQGMEDLIQDVAFSPDGGTLAIASGHSVTLRSVIDGELLHTLQAERYVSELVEKVLFSPDGSMLVSLVKGGIARFWSGSRGDLLHTLNLGDFYHLQFSPDSSLIGLLSQYEISIWGISP